MMVKENPSSKFILRIKLAAMSIMVVLLISETVRISIK
jgi:hypothetical protein